MRAGPQRQPLAARLAAAAGASARTIVAHRRAGPAIGVGAAVSRVGHHPVDAAVAGPTPDDGAAAPPRRQLEVVLVEPQQRLAGAAELRHLVEHQPDRLLHAPVRVLLQPVAGLDEADRGGDHQLAPPRLGVARRERTLPQQVELVLVQAALEPEQQAVVAVARRVDRLAVHQHRVHHPAHLDQLLPVAAVAGEPGHLPRRHRAHLAQADLGHHPARSRRAPRRPRPSARDRRPRPRSPTSRARRAGRAWRIAARGFRDCAGPGAPRTGARRRSPRAPGDAA